MTQANGRGGATQQRVRDAVARVGGYWRPLAGVARLLEELGELAANLAHPAAAPGDFASELADLWIITTAVVDQFLGDAVEPGSHHRQTSATSPTIGDLLVTAGQIARIVNYYDGPKTPRSVEGLPTLNDAVAEFQRVLAAVAQAHAVDLGVTVNEKLDATPTRDSGRFVHREHDPSTAPCLERFRLTQATTPVPQHERARLWGAPAWSPQSLASNVDAIVSPLTSFTRAATRERLDAYVIPGPPCGSVESLFEWLEEFLGELSDRDPKRDGLVRGSLGSAGWRLRFNGLSMSVTVFSPLYDSGHARHSSTDTFVVLRLRPDESA